MTATETEMAQQVVVFKGPKDERWRQVEDADEAVPQEESGPSLDSVLLSSLQMHHVAVLAGSGCSVSVGGPSMERLWMECTGATKDGEWDSPDFDRTEPIAEKVNHSMADSNIETFLSKLESYLYLKNEDEVAQFLRETKATILEECSSFLHAGENGLDAHRNFLHKLSRRRVRDPRLQVFTTNYDICFERAAASLGIVVLDGFSFTTPRHYDPRYFDYDIVRRPRQSGETGSYLEGVFHLYKIHGSVNWAREHGGRIVEKTVPDPDQVCMIYPAHGKYQQSFTQPHLEAMARYLEMLRTPNTCVVVVGWGFNDAHLAEPLVNAISSNPHLRVIAVGPDLDGDSTRSNRHLAQLDELRQQGADVWLVNATFDLFAELIPDLTALTPAESLANAIGHIARGAVGGQA